MVDLTTAQMRNQIRECLGEIYAIVLISPPVSIRGKASLRPTGDRAISKSVKDPAQQGNGDLRVESPQIARGVVRANRETRFGNDLPGVHFVGRKERRDGEMAVAFRQRIIDWGPATTAREIGTVKDDHITGRRNWLNYTAIVPQYDETIALRP